ncbi:MAG: glycosyltransferase [Candidatus Saccharimonadales bacterium]
MDRISIIVPVYNVHRYLVDCMESLINQTYADIEIILVNDGSTDDSGKICDQYAEKYANKIKVLHKQNEGLNYARRDGFLASSGNYIVFVDSDDVVARRFIEILKKLLDEYYADIAVGGYCQFEDIGMLDLSESNKPNVHFEKNKITTLGWLIEGGAPWSEYTYLMTAWGKLYKREVIERIDWDFSNYRANEDEFWTLQVFNNTNNGILMIDSRLYGYRQNQQSITRKKYVNEYEGRRMNKFEFIGHLYEKSLAYLGSDFSKPLVHRLGFNTVDFIDIYTDRRDMDIENIISAQRLLRKYGSLILENLPSGRIANKIKQMKQLSIFGYMLRRRTKKIALLLK